MSQSNSSATGQGLGKSTHNDDNDDGNAKITYLVGGDFLAQIDPSFDPVISEAGNGDRIEIRGEGTFKGDDDNSITGGGTFTHKNASGTVLANGTWTAKELESFKSFGSASVQGLPPEFEGGIALLRIRLSPAAGGGKVNAILRIDCALGNFPPGLEEGIILTTRAKPPLRFNNKISGATLFIRQPDEDDD